MPDPTRIFIVDDDQEQLGLLARLLTVEGFEVQTASSPIGVSNAVRRFQPSLVLVDVNIPALPGPQVVELIRRNVRPEDCKLILFSAVDPTELARLAQEVDADGYLPKEFDGASLARHVRQLLRH